MRTSAPKNSHKKILIPLAYQRHAPNPQAVSTRTAVLIDGNRTDLLAHKMKLKKEDFADAYATFTGGKAALNYIAKTALPKLKSDNKMEFDIFLDLETPSMDGFTFLKQVDKLVEKDKKNFKVYLVTSATNPLVLQRAASCDLVYGFVSKN